LGGNPPFLPHAILIQPPTKVSIKLGGRYRKLTLTAACLKETAPGVTSLKVSLDGKPVKLNEPHIAEDFDTDITGIVQWSMHVSGVRNLQLAVGNVLPDNISGCPLLVTGNLSR
jgi:hypothetical protein